MRTNDVTKGPKEECRSVSGGTAAATSEEELCGRGGRDWRTFSGFWFGGGMRWHCSTLETFPAIRSEAWT